MSRLRFRFQTVEFGDDDIHVRSLRDLQQFSDDQGAAESLGISSAQWSLFGVLWASSFVLADLMAGFPVGTRRVLEVGSGLGLASLLLNHRGHDVTAMDRHPCANAFMDVNTALNGDPTIPFFEGCWDDDTLDMPRFDLIIASDILYEDPHAVQLAAFVIRRAAPACEVIIVDAGRGQRKRLDALLAVAGFDHTELDAKPPRDDSAPFRGRIHRYARLAAPSPPAAPAAPA